MKSDGGFRVKVVLTCPILSVFGARPSYWISAQAREPVAMFGSWFEAWPRDLDLNLAVDLSPSPDWSERRFKRKKLNLKFS